MLSQTTTPADILRTVRRIDIRTKRLVDGILAGTYKSVFKGRGIEFSDIREYVAGDDIRAIDWNITARMHHPYVKEYQEERDLTLYLLFDISGSGSFGHRKEKRLFAAEAAASLLFSAAKNGDRTGLVLFSNGVERYVPPRKGRRHVLLLIREMLTRRPKDRTTDLAEALRFLQGAMRRKSIVVIVSDFLDERSSYQRRLAVMAKHHDVVCIRLVDSREIDLPSIGFVELEDEETGERLVVDTASPAFREAYPRLAASFREEQDRQFRKAGIDAITLKTGDDIGAALHALFAQKSRHRVW